MHANDTEKAPQPADLHGLPTEETLLPDYDGLSIAAVPRLIAYAFGDAPQLPVALQSLWDRTWRSPPSRVVLLVLDGLGYLHLQELLAELPDLFLAECVDRGGMLPLTSVFPPTTASAMSTLATGATPQVHGMLGYRLHLRETKAITNMVRLTVHRDGREDSALAAGLDVDTFLGADTVYTRLRQLGVSSHVSLARQIAGSGLSQLLYGQADGVHPVGSFTDLLVTARELLQQDGPRFVTLYWGSLDMTAHGYGPSNERYAAELRALDACLRQQLDAPGVDAALVVTADHGMVDMSAEDYVPLERIPGLQAALRLPLVGEPRATYAHVAEGEIERAMESIAPLAELGLACVKTEDALQGGLFGGGPIAPEVRHRIGDLVIVSTGRAGLFHAYPDAVRLRGMHGGLTPREMMVPLIFAPLGG